MIEKNDLILNEIKNKIYTIRGIQVMLDSDLAEIYEVETKRLNEAVKRNTERFPETFCFQLTITEYNTLRSQIATLDKSRGKHNKYLPYVFTEFGISMLSAVLNSKIAIKISIQIIKIFVLLRKGISSNLTIKTELEIIKQNHYLLKSDTETKFDKIFSLLEDPNTKKNQGIFFNGQIFDSHVFISDLIKSAKFELILIDNYVDESTLNLFIKRENNVKVIIYTKITSSLKQDLEKYNLQYEPIEIKEFNLSHDRFLIIDNKEVYHIGASLKDLGKKWFGFSKLEIESLSIIDKLK